MVLLVVVTVGYLPLALPLFLEGITVNAAKIARSLVVPMLIPLAVGLLLRAYRPGAAGRIRPTAGWISNISMILVVVLTTAGDFKSVLSVFGTFGPWPPSRTRWSASESDGSLEDPERAPGGRSKPILQRWAAVDTAPASPTGLGQL
jgi:hypothetical protein